MEDSVMVYVFARHKVEDYSTWKSTFDEFINKRRAGGEKSFQILHQNNDSNNLFLVFEWDSLDNARKFMSSEELKNTMRKAGVMEEPQIHFLNEVDKGVV
jgi:heme-degrading monooxygenase HmoA